MQRKISKRQFQANRENAKLSTGPRTVEGKAKVRWNAVKHGLLAKTVILTDPEFQEKKEEFDFLFIQLQNELKPIGILEEMLVERIAVNYWRLRRVMRAEAGEIGRGLVKIRKHESQRHEFVESLSNVAPGTYPLEMTYSKSISGIWTMLDLLSKANKEITQDGRVSNVTQEILYQVFGKDQNSVSVLADRFSKVVVGQRSKLVEKDPEKYKDLPTEEECRKGLISMIDAKREYFEAISFDVEQLEMQSRQMDQLALNIPSAEITEKTLRYETSLQRQLNRDIDQLERMQRGRKGERIPPPINVDIN